MIHCSQRTHSIIIFLLLSLDLFGHCLGNDKTFFKIPTLSSTNVTYRSSFCYVFDDVFENGTIDKRDALHDKILTVGIFDYQLNSYTGGIDNRDVSVMFLDELARRAGFEWRNSYGVLESPSDYNNYTYSDVLFWTTDVYDLMGEYYLRTPERLEQGIEFLEPHTDGSYALVMKKNSNKIQWTLIFSPFTRNLWLLTIFTVIITGIFYFQVDYLDSRRKSEEMEASLSGNVFLAAYAFTGQALYEPRTVSTRIVAWSLCFMYMVLISIYTANMATLLIMKRSSVVSVNTIDEAIEKDLSVCVWKSTIIETYMRKYYPSAKIIALYTEDECAESLISGDCDVYLSFVHSWEHLKRDATYNGDCGLESVGLTHQQFGGSFTLKESSELCSTFLSHTLSLHMIDMKLDGTFEKIWEDNYENLGSHNCENDNDEPENEAELQVGAIELASLFIIHYIFIVSALVISIVNCKRMPQEKRKRVAKEIRQTIKNPGKLKKAATFAHRHSNQVVSNKKQDYEKTLEYLRSIDCSNEDDVDTSNELCSTDDTFEIKKGTQRESDYNARIYSKKLACNESDTNVDVGCDEEKCEITAEDCDKRVSYENPSYQKIKENTSNIGSKKILQILEAVTDFIREDLDDLSGKKSK